MGRLLAPLRVALWPSSELSDEAVTRGVRFFTLEGAASMGLASMTGGSLITAFALLMGANNSQIGILAALPFATMPLQVLTVVLVEKFRKRKLIALPA